MRFIGPNGYGTVGKHTYGFSIIYVGGTDNQLRLKERAIQLSRLLGGIFSTHKIEAFPYDFGEDSSVVSQLAERIQACQEGVVLYYHPASRENVQQALNTYTETLDPNQKAVSLRICKVQIGCFGIEGKCPGKEIQLQKHQEFEI